MSTTIETERSISGYPKTTDELEPITKTEDNNELAHNETEGLDSPLSHEIDLETLTRIQPLIFQLMICPLKVNDVSVGFN